MTQAASLPRSTIGKKILMAVTGFLLIAFVFVHMLGNLKIFAGPGTPDHPAKLDTYAHFLRDFGAPVLGHEQFLWIARIGLLALVGIHLWAALSLWITNRKARPVRYRKWTPDASNYASRTMIWGGAIIAFFVVYHILHFTTGTLHGNFTGSAYANVIYGFQRWPVALAYIVANLALGLHLYHGVWSALRTVGANNPRFEPARKSVAVAFAVATAGGNISIPVAVLAGVLK